MACWAVAAWAMAAACASDPPAAVDDVVDLEAVVRSVVRGASPSTAVLVVDNASGQVVDSVVVGETATAPVGGGQRPAGSVIKVVVLAAALEAGIPPDHVLDVPKCLQLAEHRACTTTPGEVTVAEAIVTSINPAFVMLTDLVGAEAVTEYGRLLGMDLEATSAVALGIDPVSMESVAAMLVALSNDGETQAIRDGNSAAIIGRSGRFVSTESALLLRAMLRSVVTDGTGVAADGPDEPFGKTGTAAGRTDAWFAGSTAAWTIVVWAGSADGTASVEPPRYPAALAGGGLPARVFRAVADELDPQTRPLGGSP